MNEWIKCSERMPEFDQRVLIYATDFGDGSKYITIASRETGHSMHFDWRWYVEGDREYWNPDGINYWMALPLLPEAEAV